MGKIIKTAFLIAIAIWSCKAKVDRDHLVFNSSVAEIENSILLIDSILVSFPETKKNVIRSFYYKIDEGDTLLFINSEKIGNIHDVDTSLIATTLNVTRNQATKVIDASLILLRNDVSHRLEDQCGWIYVYKYSNERGEFRPLVYSRDSQYISQLADGQCGYNIIDRKGKLVLFEFSRP
ncbi:MAG: hypothetical protein ABIN80_24035 [Dyadobacter sp.]|uniref:hypothetical protein n=1 Tax=Dyadobacter sp. TaxID=1914288 RepID=UPI0032635F28